MELKLEMPDDLLQQWNAQVRDLWACGTPAVIEGPGIRISGSPAMEAVSAINAASRFTMHAIPRESSLKWSVVQGNGTHVSLDDVSGQIILGQLACNFSAKTLGSVVDVALSFQREQCDTTMSGAFSIGLDPTPWEDCEVTRLPYFTKIEHLFTALTPDAYIDASVEIEGERLICARLTLGAELLAQEVAFLSLLQYTRNVRQLAQQLRVPVTFSLAKPISVEQQEQVAWTVAVLNGNWRSTRSDRPVVFITKLIPTEETTYRLSELADSSPESKVIRLGMSSETIELFGHSIALPTLEFLLSGASIANKENVREYKSGEIVDVTITATAASARYLLSH